MSFVRFRGPAGLASIPAIGQMRSGSHPEKVRFIVDYIMGRSTSEQVRVVAVAAARALRFSDIMDFED